VNTSRSQPRRAALLAVGTAILSFSALSACSSAAAKPDACKLIDPAAAGKILGATITTKPIQIGSADDKATSMCSYQDGTVGGGFMLLAAELHPKNLADEVASEEKSVTQDSGPPGLNLPKPEVRDISGLGDAAFLVSSAQSLELHVFAHGAKVVIVRNVKPTPDLVDQTEKLARLALAKLP
jgi:hypothetical protein